jgi:hypothetical protein
VAFKICRWDGRRCSSESCSYHDDLGFVHLCKRYKKPRGFNKRRFLKNDPSRRNACAGLERCLVNG